MHARVFERAADWRRASKECPEIVDKGFCIRGRKLAFRVHFS
jgi:hypothetical protein